MEPNEYQNFAAETAFYPGRSAGLPSDCDHGNILKCVPIAFPGYAYTALGLVGELGEVLFLLPDDNEHVNKSAIRKELGDVFWYLSQFSMEIGVPYTKLFPAHQVLIDKTDIPILCGEICELVKKAIRDNFGKTTPDFINKCVSYLTQINVWLCHICESIGYTKEDIWEENVNKLRSRKDRGVLGGSGNDR